MLPAVPANRDRSVPPSTRSAIASRSSSLDASHTANDPPSADQRRTAVASASSTTSPAPASTRCSAGRGDDAARRASRPPTGTPSTWTTPPRQTRPSRGSAGTSSTRPPDARWTATSSWAQLPRSSESILWAWRRAGAPAAVDGPFGGRRRRGVPRADVDHGGRDVRRWRPDGHRDRPEPRRHLAGHLERPGAVIGHRQPLEHRHESDSRRGEPPARRWSTRRGVTGRPTASGRSTGLSSAVDPRSRSTRDSRRACRAGRGPSRSGRARPR